MPSPMIKGFLIGSSFGVLATLLGFMESMPRSIILGSLMGVLAGATMKFKQAQVKKLPEEKTDENDEKSEKSEKDKKKNT